MAYVSEKPMSRIEIPKAVPRDAEQRVGDDRFHEWRYCPPAGGWPFTPGR
jgi:hypothetical protein